MSARSTPPPHEHHTHNATDDDAYVTWSEPHIKLNGNANHAEPEAHNFDLLVHELVIRDNRSGDWAEEVDSEGRLILQGEYMQDNQPPAPPPIPWYPPPPPTTRHMPPRTHYTPPRNRYTPSRTRFTPQYPSYCPHCRYAPTQRPPFETCAGHVTATQRNGFRATVRAAHSGPPRYIPPAL